MESDRSVFFDDMVVGVDVGIFDVVCTTPLCSMYVCVCALWVSLCVSSLGVYLGALWVSLSILCGNISVRALCMFVSRAL